MPETGGRTSGTGKQRGRPPPGGGPRCWIARVNAGPPGQPGHHQRFMTRRMFMALKLGSAGDVSQRGVTGADCQVCQEQMVCPGPRHAIGPSCRQTTFWKCGYTKTNIELPDAVFQQANDWMVEHRRHSFFNSVLFVRSHRPRDLKKYVRHRLPRPRISARTTEFSISGPSRPDR